MKKPPLNSASPENRLNKIPPKFDTQQEITAAKNGLNKIQQELDTQQEITTHKINKLDNLIKIQKIMIKNLERELGSLRNKPIPNGSTFEVWSGILLACVAVILTALGVAVATISLIGFRNVRTESGQIATKIAQEITAEVAEKKLKEHIDEGRFNHIIEGAIDRVAFSNITSDPDLDYTEETSDEDL